MKKNEAMTFDTLDKVLYTLYDLNYVDVHIKQ